MSTAENFLAPIRIGPDQITDTDAPEDPRLNCPGCGKRYPGKARRCYWCKPPGRKGGITGNRSEPKRRRLASIEALNFAAGLTENPPVEHSPRRSTAARGELRAMAEILTILESLEPDAARRALAWVADRIGREA